MHRTRYQTIHAKRERERDIDIMRYAVWFKEVE